MSLHVSGARFSIGNDSDSFQVEIPDIHIEQGKMAALVGPSGAGKTTVLELLSLMRQPQSVDKLMIAGLDVREMSLMGGLNIRAQFRARYVTYIVQSGGMLPYLSAFDNALAGIHASGNAVGKTTLEHLEASAKSLGILNVLHKKRAELSGGERRRVGLLRAMTAPKELVLVDEPTSALDAENSDKAISALVSLSRGGGSTVVIATHEYERVRDAGFQIFKLKLNEGGRFRVLTPADNM